MNFVTIKDKLEVPQHLRIRGMKLQSKMVETRKFRWQNLQRYSSSCKTKISFQSRWAQIWSMCLLTLQANLKRKCLKFLLQLPEHSHTSTIQNSGLSIRPSSTSFWNSSSLENSAFSTSRCSTWWAIWQGTIKMMKWVRWVISLINFLEG